MAYTGSSRFLRTSTSNRRPLSSVTSSFTSSYTAPSSSYTSSVTSARTRQVSESSNSSVEATEDPYGQDDELVPVQYFKKLLECPVCLEYLKSPVHQCWEGHLLCKKCFKGKKLTQCPICRGSLFQNRNLAVEDVLCILRNPINRQKIQNEVEAVPPNSVSSLTKEDLESIMSLCVKNEVQTSLNEFKESMNTRLLNLEKKVTDSITQMSASDESENFGKILKSCSDINSKLSGQNGELVKGLAEMSKAICDKFDEQDGRVVEMKNDLENVRSDLESNFVTESMFKKNQAQVDDSFKSLGGKISLALRMLTEIKDGMSALGSADLARSKSDHRDTLPNGIHEMNGVKKDNSISSIPNKMSDMMSKVPSETDLNKPVRNGIDRDVAPTEFPSAAEAKAARAPSEPLQDNQVKLPLRKAKSDTDHKPASRDDLHSILSQIVNKLERAIESRESLDEPGGSTNVEGSSGQSNAEDHVSESEASETESDESEATEVPPVVLPPAPVFQIYRAQPPRSPSIYSQSASESDGEYFDPAIPGPSGLQGIPESLPCPLHYIGDCSVPHSDTRSHLINLARFSPWSADNGCWTYQSRIFTRHNVVIVENLGRWFQVAFNQIVTDSGVCSFIQVRLVADEPDRSYDFYVDVSLYMPDKDGFFGSIQHEVKPYWTQPAANLLKGMDFLFRLSDEEVEEYRGHGGQLNFQIEFLAVEKDTEE